VVVVKMKGQRVMVKFQLVFVLVAVLLHHQHLGLFLFVQDHSDQ
jgi:hypothetical protein